MYEAAIWWLIVEILSLAALPVAAFLFRRLPDKGFGLAKPLGILLPAYGFWVLSSLGILDNRRASMALVVATLGLIAWAGLSEGRREALRLWREGRAMVILVEVLFALAFGAWCFVRSYTPEIAGTEKPMEIAFLNGVLRSERFPPVDAWLAGYSISYYYFGYVMVAMLAKLAGVASSVAFNLAIAMLFALTVTGAFTLAYDLAAGRRWGSREDSSGNPSLAIGSAVCGLLGALFVAVMGNLEGLLEAIYSRAALPASFWQWLNIQGLDKPYLSNQWYPTEWFWWFRASRIIADFDPITKVSRDYTINEFPFFSFLLGDLHPHVIALPFTFVAMGLALCLLKTEEPPTLRGLYRRPLELFLWTVILGALGFLNSWDMPTYLAILALAFAVNRRLAGAGWIRESIIFGVALLGVAVALYVPFYLGFSSQVKGIGIVMQRTKLHQFAIIWGPFLFFIAAFLVAKYGSVRSAAIEVSKRGWPAIKERLSGAVSNQPPRIESAALPERARKPGLGQGGPVVVLGALIAVAMVAVIVRQAAVLALLLPMIVLSYTVLTVRGDSDGGKSLRSEDRFVALLALVGALLLLVCELLFVRDFFGNRMNTVFKVYYQVWQMLAVASAYVIYCFLQRKRFVPVGWLFRGGSLVAFALAILLSIGAFVYPVTATVAKTNGFTGKPVLDGLAFMAEGQRGDYEAITWLNKNVTGTPVILEAAGGSYSQFGRVSAFTGLPTVVGWDGHELQWRGSGDEAARRRADVGTIYQTLDEQVARSLLNKYGVVYVYVGRLEREAYGAAGALGKFATFSDTVYRNDEVTIHKLRLGAR